jgi:hypothetical protein
MQEVYEQNKKDLEKLEEELQEQKQKCERIQVLRDVAYLKVGLDKYATISHKIIGGEKSHWMAVIIELNMNHPRYSALMCEEKSNNYMDYVLKGRIK